MVSRQQHYAGIHHAKLENVIFIDVDLQDPPELIIDMYKFSKQGYDTILAKRKRKKEKIHYEILFQKIVTFLFLKLSDTNIPSNVGEYRLISKKILNEIIET